MKKILKVLGAVAVLSLTLTPAPGSAAGKYPCLERYTGETTEHMLPGDQGNWWANGPHGWFWYSCYETHA